MSRLQSNDGKGMPALWRPRRIMLCTGLVLASILQAIGAIVLSESSAALLRSEESLYGLPVLTILGISAVFVLGLFVAQQKYAEQFALTYVHEVRMAYARHALLVPFDIKAPGLGLSLTRLVNDLGAVKLWLSRGLLALIGLVPILATLSVFVAIFEPPMLMPLLAAGLVWIFAVLGTLPGLRHSIRKSRQKRGGISLLLGRALPDRLPLLVHGKLEPLLARLAKRSNEMCRYLMLRAVWSGVLKAGCRASFPVAVCVYALTSGFDADRIVLFLMVFSFLATQLEAGAAGIEYYQANKVAREKLMRLFSLPSLKTEPLTSPERNNSQAYLEIGQLRLPSGEVLTEQIEQGSCTTLVLRDAQDLRHLYLSLAGLTDASSQDRIALNGVAFTTLGSKQIWRNVALIAPENGFPDYQRKQSPAAFGNRGPISQAVLDKLATQLGNYASCQEQAPENLSEEERLGIRIARALLRAPSLVVIADSAVLASREWMTHISEAAEETGTTLLCLSRSAEAAPKGAA